MSKNKDGKVAVEAPKKLKRKKYEAELATLQALRPNTATAARAGHLSAVAWKGSFEEDVIGILRLENLVRSAPAPSDASAKGCLAGPRSTQAN